MGKVYVSVWARAEPDGRIIPEAFKLRGQTLVVERVLERREARATKAGGRGTRYTVRVGQAQACLFMDEERRWYVEEEEHVREVPHHDGG